MVGALGILCTTGPFAIAEQSPIENTLREPDLSHHEAEVGIPESSFVVVPIPSHSEQLGYALAVAVGYLFQMDEGSRGSNIGLGYFRSDNGSTGYGAMANLAWGNDAWSLLALAGTVDLNYDFYVAGLPVPLNQSGDLAMLKLKHSVGNHWYLGGMLQYLESDIALDTGGLIPPEILPSVGLELATVGLLAEYDTRDNSYYPTRGLHANISLTYGSEIHDLIPDHQKALAKLDGYWPVGSKGVVAARLTGCAASQNTPFFNLCGIGSSDGMRGFASMRFTDRQLMSAQIEYRQRIGDSRFGFVAFAGAGAAAQQLTSVDQEDIHAAAGIGLRFRLSKKFPLDYSADVAFNDEGEQTLHLYVGQSF